MLPLLAVAGAAAGSKLLGNLVGGIGQSNDTQKGMNAYKNYVGQGTNILSAGAQSANQAYSPYTQAGQTGVQGYTDAIQNRQNAPMAAVTDNSAQNALTNYLDPSAEYTMDQASKATQASALAKGGMGGGLAKALSNNANKMAMTNYNNAYNQMLQGNAQTYGQQNTNYQNQTAYDQSQIGNYGNLANLGLTATGQNQQNQLGYNNLINQNYVDIANSQQSGWNQKGKIFGDTANSFGNNLASGISSIYGAYSGSK